MLPEIYDELKGSLISGTESTYYSSEEGPVAMSHHEINQPSECRWSIADDGWWRPNCRAPTLETDRHDGSHPRRESGVDGGWRVLMESGWRMEGFDGEWMEVGGF